MTKTYEGPMTGSSPVRWGKRLEELTAKQIIRDMRRWMKGKKITKEKVREYLNKLEKGR